jgi:MFS family permease
VLIGIGEAAYGPTAPTLISDMYPVEKRGAVLAWFFMAIPVGSALGYALGGFAASHWTWHWAFLVTLPPGIALGIWALTRPEPKRGGADVSATNRHAKLADYRTLLHTRTFVMNNLAQTAMTFAVGGIAFWMPKYIFEKLKTGNATTDDALLAHIGTTFGAITVLAGLSATLLGGYLGDKLRTHVRGAYLQVSGWGMLACFPCFVGALYTPFPYAWGLLALAMFFLFLNTGPSNTALANVVHPSIRASAFAVNIFVIHALGDAISPAIIGKLKDSTGSFTIGFLVVSVMILVSGVLWLIGSRTLDADTAAAPNRMQN